MSEFESESLSTGNVKDRFERCLVKGRRWFVVYRGIGDVSFPIPALLGRCHRRFYPPTRGFHGAAVSRKRWHAQRLTNVLSDHPKIAVDRQLWGD